MARTLTEPIATRAGRTELTVALAASRQRSLGRDALQSFFRRKSAAAGLILVVLFVLAAVIGQFATPYDPYRSSLRDRLLAPSAVYLMGTDGFGRDILSGILRGALIALEIGVVAVSIGAVFCCLQGLIAAYYRGWIGAIIMRFTDALLAFPLILLALAIMATL